MKKESLIFRNSKQYINEGNGNGKGILYCGKKYSNEGCCKCGTCNGYCGPDNGCACPDCEYTLSYLLYSTGKMLCEKCNKTLIRINIFNLKNILKSKTNQNPSFQCNICNKSFSNEISIPLMHCMKCNYNMCPSCAFEKLISIGDNTINKKVINISDLQPGTVLGDGCIYCTRNYAEYQYCLCGGCDGNCGPGNGCPCPLCDTILGYNLYLNSNNMKCDKCGSLLVKTTVFLLNKNMTFYKSLFKSLFKCFICNTENNKEDCQMIYNCPKCSRSMCQPCAFKNNIFNIKNISFPNMPISKGIITQQIKEMMIREEINRSSVCKEKSIKIKKQRGAGKIISFYAKTLMGKIISINNINDNEYVWKIIEELEKIDSKFKIYNTILVYKNTVLENDDHIDDYGIENDSIINIIPK